MPENKEISKPGRKTEVSPEQVIKAASILQEQRRKITGWSLREVIGSGGPNNLLNIYQSHESKNSDVVLNEDIEVEKHILPPPLEDKISILLGDISRQINIFACESDSLANTLADKKAHSAYETMIQSNKELVEEQDLANQIIIKADEESDALRLNVTQLKTDFQTQQKSLNNSNNEIIKISDELTRCKFILAETQSKFQDSSTENLSLAKAITKLETRLEDATVEKKLCKQEFLKVSIQLSEATSMLQTKESNLVQLEKEIDRLKTVHKNTISALENERSSLNTEIKQITSTASEQKEKLVLVTSKYDAQQSILIEKDKLIASLEAQIKQVRLRN